MSAYGENGYIDNIEDVYRVTYGIDTDLNILPITSFTTVKKQGSPAKDVYYEDKIIDLITPNETIQINGNNGRIIKLTVSGTYVLRYKGTNAFYSTNVVSGNKVRYYSDYSFYYTIAVVENKKPLKKWSITDVINRTLDLAEPIRKGERPRFKLAGMNWDGTIQPNIPVKRFLTV